MNQDHHDHEHDHDDARADAPPSGTPWPDGAPPGPHAPEDAEPWRCHARSKQTGKRCGQRAMRGQRVCYAHGGRNPAAIAAAARRMDAERVAAEVGHVLAAESPVPVTDPLGLLAELAGEASQLRTIMAGKVAELGDAIRYTAPGAGTEQLRGEVLMYERAMDRAAKFADMLVRSGFREREVRVSEQQGELVAQAVRTILAGMLEAVRRSLAHGDPVPADALVRLEADWGRAVGEVVPPALRAMGERTGAGRSS